MKAETVEASAIIFGKDLAKQGDNLALQARSHVDDKKLLAVKFTYGMKIAGFHGGFALPAKPNDIVDDDAVNSIVSGLADVYAA